MSNTPNTYREGLVSAGSGKTALNPRDAASELSSPSGNSNQHRVEVISPRREYIGYRLVSLDDFDGWVAMNIDALFHNYALTGGLDLEQLAAFSAREYEHERELREGYARTAEAFDGAI